MRIDGDLLHVAAEASPSLEDSALNRDEIRAWGGKSFDEGGLARLRLSECLEAQPELEKARL